MSKRVFKRFCFSLLTILGCIAPTAYSDSSEDFGQLLHSHWERSEQEQVFFRRDPDSFRMNGALPSYSTQSRLRRQAYNEEILAQLDVIDSLNLTEAERVSLLVFEYERLAERESYGQPEHLFPLTNRSNWQSYFVNAVENMSFLNEGDYRRYLTSLADYERYNGEQLELMREALAAKYTHYCDSMMGYDSTLSVSIVKDPRDSALYAPFESMPVAIPANVRAELEVQGKALIANVVLPEFQKFLDFYRSDYAPACRKSVGVSSLRGGEDYYAYLVKFFTTTDMTAKEIHTVGLSEVDRIHSEMEALIREVGFSGSFEAFLEFLRVDPQFYASDAEDLLEKVSRISKRMDGQLPRLFATLPRNTYDVKAVPAVVAERTTGAYYVPAPGDGRTPGPYFINTSLLESRPLFTMEALSFHEAVPGHHLQSSIAQEQDIPQFRRFLNHGAFTEGWGLYSERLGLEVGFYTDPYSNFGRLSYEMWRACRLVVDTGMHSFGWSRQKAIDYLAGKTGMDLHSATAEIDRYITWPGQALSYKIGELKIRELRQRAESTLGERFDLREFHDLILANGSLPLTVLEQVAESWMGQF
jgi:uncharacterized protein (DUF885 family)